MNKEWKEYLKNIEEIKKKDPDRYLRILNKLRTEYPEVYKQVVTPPPDHKDILLIIFTLIIVTSSVITVYYFRSMTTNPTTELRLDVREVICDSLSDELRITLVNADSEIIKSTVLSLSLIEEQDGVTITISRNIPDIQQGEIVTLIINDFKNFRKDASYTLLISGAGIKPKYVTFVGL